MLGVDRLGVYVPVIRIDTTYEQVSDAKNNVVSESSSLPISATISRIQVRLLHLQLGVSF